MTTPGAEVDAWRRFVVLVDHLERRRAVNDQAMWLAPVLVVAGQAFLLQVLSTDGLETAARAIVLAAGLAASLAALLTLQRGRAREVQYSEAIAHYSAEIGFQSVRPPLPRIEPAGYDSFWHPLDHRLRHAALAYAVPPAPLFWTLALLLFGAADVAVFCTA